MDKAKGGDVDLAKLVATAQKDVLESVLKQLESNTDVEDIKDTIRTALRELEL